MIDMLYTGIYATSGTHEPIATSEIPGFKK